MQHVNINYIAGLIDGEGCLEGRIVNRHKGYSSGGSISVAVSVECTSLVMIEALRSFYSEHDIQYLVEFGRWRKMSTRPAHKITVDRKKDVEKLLKTLLPFLMVKLSEAKLVLSWLEIWGHDMRGSNQYKLHKVPTKAEKGRFVSDLRELKNVA